MTGRSRNTMLCMLLLTLACLLLGLGRAPAADMSPEQVEEWVEILRTFRVPEPGPISSETSRLQRAIMRAPLEEMPPELRTGVALRQIDILHNNGDWEGVQRLRARVLDGEGWTRADQDGEVLAAIASYDIGVVFAAPGGRREGQSIEVFADISLAHWQRNIQNRNRFFETLQRIVDESDPHSVRTAGSILRLAEEARRSGNHQRADELIALLDGLTVAELHGVGYYDRDGTYITPERVMYMYEQGLANLYKSAGVPYSPGPVRTDAPFNMPIQPQGTPKPSPTPWEISGEEWAFGPPPGVEIVLAPGATPARWVPTKVADPAPPSPRTAETSLPAPPAASRPFALAAMITIAVLGLLAAAIAAIRFFRLR